MNTVGDCCALQSLIHHLHYTQTLTTLDLGWNYIGDEGAQSLANTLQVNTVRRLLCASITYSPPSLHTDTYNAESSDQQDRRGRRTVFGECIANEHGRRLLCAAISYSPPSLHTDTHNAGSWLELYWRRRSTVFGEYIASEPGETTFVRFDHLFTTFIAHRHSQRWILEATASAQKEHSLWRMHCRWTRWDDFCALRSLIHQLHCTQTLTALDLQRNNIGVEGAHSLANALQMNMVRRLLCTSITYSPPSLHTDTHNAESSTEQHQRGRSTVFGGCFATEHGETTFVRIDHLFTTFIAHRHSQRWILAGTISAQKEHSLWRIHCRWTRWDDFCALRSLIHHLHCTQTLANLDLNYNNIGAEGAQILANALQVNTVRRLLCALIIYSLPSLHTDTHNAESSGQQDRRRRSTVFGECIAGEHGETTFAPFDHLFTIFIAHRHSQRWILEATASAQKEHSLWRMHCKWTR